jgi:hypothetical protein
MCTRKVIHIFVIFLRFETDKRHSCSAQTIRWLRGNPKIYTKNRNVYIQPWIDACLLASVACWKWHIDIRFSECGIHFRTCSVFLVTVILRTWCAVLCVGAFVRALWSVHLHITWEVSTWNEAVISCMDTRVGVALNPHSPPPHLLCIQVWVACSVCRQELFPLLTFDNLVDQHVDGRI